MSIPDHNILSRPVAAWAEDAPTDAELDDPEADDPFRYGWRYVSRIVNGVAVEQAVPLTLYDVLHPQEDDHRMQWEDHVLFCTYLHTMLLDHFRHDPTTKVFWDLRTDFNLPGIEPMGPDISVVFGVQPRAERSTFWAAEEGTVPALIIEVTSPHTWHQDVPWAELTQTEQRREGAGLKFEYYAQAGVSMYLIVDKARRRPGHPMPIMGYRLTPNQTFERLVPDAFGRFWIPSIELSLGPHGDKIALYDANGNELETRPAAQQRAATAEAKRQAAQQRAATAEVERQEAQQRIATAEDEQQAEQQARLRAETKQQAAQQRAAAAEAERQAAQQRAVVAEAERQAAQQRAAIAEAERQVAQQRAAELEAKLRHVEAQLRQPE